MKNYTLNLLYEIRRALSDKELSTMKLSERIKHEIALVKLNIVIDFVNKFLTD